MEEKIDLDALRTAASEAQFELRQLRHEDFKGSDGDSDGDSDSDGDDFATNQARNGVEEVARALHDDTQGLMDLDALIQAAVPDPEARVAADVAPRDWAPHLVFCDRIAQRFPKAGEGLVTRLAKVNLSRLLMVKSKRDANLPAHREPTPDAGTEAFQDSAIGTSLVTPSAYAETLMSYACGEGQLFSIRIPPLPEGAKAGKQFECVACGRLLRITRNKAWK